MNILKFILHCLLSGLANFNPWKLITPRYLAVLVLAVHAGLLSYSATKHSPTADEPAHLAAGLANWKFRRFALYRVNPPLVRMIAAIPVMVIGYQENWSQYYEGPDSRPEFLVGEDLLEANGQRSRWLFIAARWACIPFSLLGGIFCYLWARDLWGSTWAGLTSLTLWCFEPNILAHAEWITPDCAASSLGLGAGYFFWRWLKAMTWRCAFAAGALLGLAEITKMTWIILFGIWPMLWLLWRLCNCNDHPKTTFTKTSSGGTTKTTVSCKKQSLSTQFAQLSIILVFAVWIINCSYLFDESFCHLGEFEFVSTGLAGSRDAGTPSNRFKGTFLGSLRVPLPKQYLMGMDVQKRDLEAGGRRSYLRGKWRDHGWLYYYAYCLVVKCPIGIQILLVVSIFASVLQRQAGRSGCAHDADNQIHRADLAVLVLPAAGVLIFISSQTSFNHHMRYVLPAFGFVFVFIGGCVSFFGRPIRRPPSSFGLDASVCIYRPVVTSNFVRKTNTLIINQSYYIINGADSSSLSQNLYSFILSMWATLYNKLVWRIVFRIVIGSTLTATVIETLSVFPHQLGFFNALVGGPAYGHKYLIHSNIDWGQDIYILENFEKSLKIDRKIFLLYWNTYDPYHLGFRYRVPPCADGLIPRGWYAISINVLLGGWNVPDGTGSGRRVTVSSDYARRIDSLSKIKLKCGSSFFVFFVDGDHRFSTHDLDASERISLNNR